MALAVRGEADREALIDYVDNLEVPSTWREGGLKVHLGGNTAIVEDRDEQEKPQGKIAGTRRGSRKRFTSKQRSLKS